MSKKRKVVAEQGTVPTAPSSSNKSRVSTEIENVENGFVIRVSSEGSGKKPEYKTKRFIASTHPQAMRIAAQGMRGMVGKKSGKKKGNKGKRFALKRA